jgi:demethylmenaquinone methyltransferase/2-methoxy-6-polyprenyl-1,4-benzoquinol methylase
MFTGSFNPVNRASLDKNPHEVASMFDGVAQRYDLTNTVLSLGQDRSWRRATRAALEL